MDMQERYGRTRIAKIKSAYDDLMAAVRSGDFEKAEAALDRYEPWADFAFARPAPEAEVMAKVETALDAAMEAAVERLNNACRDEAICAPKETQT